MTDAVRDDRERGGCSPTGFYLTTAFMDLADDSYIAGADPRDPRVSPLYADLPAGLAPAYVATAGFDPLRDEGEAYARRLAEAGRRRSSCAGSTTRSTASSTSSASAAPPAPPTPRSRRRCGRG